MQDNKDRGSGGELKRHALSSLTLFIMIFVLVCGGYFGIEDIVSQAGPGLSIAVLILVPIFWAAPQALIASELGSALPEEGGYYKWVQRAFGEFWGFQVGWWRTISCYVDSTLYVVLAVGYIDVFLSLSPLSSFLLKTFLILFFTWINYRGIADVGLIGNILTAVMFATLVLFIVIGFAHWQYNPYLPFIPEGQTLMQSLGFGFAFCIWIYSGYESMGTMAGEIQDLRKLPKLTLLSIPVVALVYILPITAGLASYGDYANWGAESSANFISMVESFGIPGIGILFTIGAVFGSLSLYNAYLASGSRGFFVIAEDRLAPPILTRINKKYGTPHIAIFSMTLLNIILAQFGFSTLVVIDVMLFMFAYLVWFLAAFWLRVKEPDLPRPFKIPLGKVGMALMCVVPIGICVTAFFTNGTSYLLGGALGLLTGPIAYVIFKRRYGGIDGEKRLKKSTMISCAALTATLLIVIAVGGSMFASLRSEAYAGFDALKNSSFSSSYSEQKRHADLEQDSFVMDMTNAIVPGATTKIWYYAGDFTGDIYLEGSYADEAAFASDAFKAYEALGGAAESGLPLASAEIYSDDYSFYAEQGEIYDSPEAIVNYLTSESEA